MFEFLTLNQEAFGLDISDASLKIIKLKKNKGFLSLSSFGEAEIKPGVIESGEVKDENSLAQIIKDGLSKVKGEKLKTKYAVISLPEEKAFLQVIQMPAMKEEELDSAIRFEAENYIPLPLDQVYLDFQVIPPISGHLDHIDVLIIALPKRIIDLYVSAIKKAGLSPKVLEIESQAVTRALIKGEVSSFPVLLIDFGATRTGFTIFSGYSIRFNSSIPVSSQEFTKSISKTLQIDLPAAEKLKMKYGLKAENEDGKKVFESMIPVLTDLTEQIKKYLNYYQTHVSHEHLSYEGVRKVFLCGGGANLKGLDDFFSFELNLPVEIGNPWVNILPETIKEIPSLPYEESLEYTTALGLALRGIQDK